MCREGANGAKRRLPGDGDCELYQCMVQFSMIRSFKDKVTEAVFHGKRPKGFPADLFAVTRRKLLSIDFATSLADLRSPPANHLEALANDRRGQHSIRVNDQFRICFRWTEAGPEGVEFVDYH